MSLKPEIITQIQSMLKADPALLAQAQAAGDTTRSAALLSTAAASNGIDVSAHDIAAYAQSTPAQTSLSDAELEHLAGGNQVFLSVVTLGFHCAAISIDAAIRGDDCKKQLSL